MFVCVEFFFFDGLGMSFLVNRSSGRVGLTFLVLVIPTHEICIAMIMRQL